jgi:hypothetical protein
MKILKNGSNLNLILNPTQDTNIDLGWEENFKDYEDEILKKIINPIENYETVRFTHKVYPMPLYPSQSQCDIWYQFKFYNGSTYNQDYQTVGISLHENSKMLKQSTESFFSLEFYKTPNNDLPNRINRRMVMTRNLSLPLGEKYFNTTVKDYLFMPIFTGSNFRNKENMYLFWFKDDTAFNETTLTGTTFWMTAKFYNANDGSIIDFVTSDLGTSEVNETNDMYYKVVLDRTNYTYQISKMDNSSIGRSGNPIMFFEKKS